MGKIISYLKRLPNKVKFYGYTVTLIKMFIDACIHYDITLPPRIRWFAAHRFHTQWKHAQREYYGVEEYNRRIDSKSLEVLNDFYETGTQFPGKTFIDIGCGTRGVLPVVNAQRKIGVDPTLKNLKDLPLQNDVEYYPDKAESLRFTCNYADIISCNNTLNHVEDPEQAIREIYRVLKPGGLLLLEVFIEPCNIAHTVEFTPDELKKLLDKFFSPKLVKYERLKVKVEIDEQFDGELPMRWGGVFQK